MKKVLRTVTDKFSLLADGRQIGANKRNYLLESVRGMIESPQTQELLRLGEAFGYYGHQSRQRANKLDLGETEMIEINGKMVLVENVPASRTIELSVDSNGVVTHTEEVLDTPSGRLVDSLISSTAGGWSWATGGKDTPQASITRSYHGMDYVLQPNFISLNHPTMMLESIQDRESMMLESLMGGGLSSESAEQALAYLKRSQVAQDNALELERENMILEGMMIERDRVIESLQNEKKLRADSASMLLESLSTMPIFISDEQKTALLRMESKLDQEIIQSMFESISAGKMASLPLQSQQKSVYVRSDINIDREDCIDLRNNQVRKFS